MSVHISAPVWKIKGLTMTQKIVLLKLADNANEAGVCWPSLQTIAEDCGCSVRTVSRAVSHFEGINLLSHDRRFNRSNMYQFNMDTLSTLSSNIDTQSNTDKTHSPVNVDTQSSGMDTQSIVLDTQSSQYGHPCPTNRKEPSNNHKRTIKEPSVENDEVSTDEDIKWKIKIRKDVIARIDSMAESGTVNESKLEQRDEHLKEIAELEQALADK